MVSERKGKQLWCWGYWDYIRYAMEKLECECARSYCQNMRENAEILCSSPLVDILHYKVPCIIHLYTDPIPACHVRVYVAMEQIEGVRAPPPHQKLPQPHWHWQRVPQHFLATLPAIGLFFAPHFDYACP
jgi:hypothetical protein